VSEPGPGVLEIRLALTLVFDPAKPIDFFSTVVPVPDTGAHSGKLTQATRRFVQDCALEAEFSESAPVVAAKSVHGKSAISAQRPGHVKRAVRAAFFDARRGADTPKAAAATWEDLGAVFARWSEFLDGQLVALRDGTFRPKLTTGKAAQP